MGCTHICCLLISCDESDSKDWTEIVRIEVSNEPGEYIPWGAPEDGPLMKALIKPDKNPWPGPQIPGYRHDVPLRWKGG